MIKAWAAGQWGNQDSNPCLPPGPLPELLLSRVKVPQHGAGTACEPGGPLGPGPHPEQPAGWGGGEQKLSPSGRSSPRDALKCQICDHSRLQELGMEDSEVGSSPGLLLGVVGVIKALSGDCKQGNTQRRQWVPWNSYTEA